MATIIPLMSPWEPIVVGERITPDGRAPTARVTIRRILVRAMLRAAVCDKIELMDSRPTDFFS